MSPKELTELFMQTDVKEHKAPFVLQKLNICFAQHNPTKTNAIFYSSFYINKNENRLKS